ncbi:hypothetical protein [Azospirillum sp. sgz302134]
MSRLVSLLALLVLAAGLLAGGAVPVRAAAGHHHHATHDLAGDLAGAEAPPSCDEAAVQNDAAPCENHHSSDPAAPGKAHAHGAAGCVCLTGACDLTGLPVRLGQPFAHRLSVALPTGEASPDAIVHAPPLPPPRV